MRFRQDVYFAKGMAHMHLLYAHDTTWSLRIEDLTPGLHDRPGPELSGTAKVFYLPDNAVKDVALAELRDTDDQGSCGPGCHFGCRPPCRQLHRNSTPYLQRGWCRAEVQWSLARKASWKSIRIPFREGRNCEAPMAPSEFRAQAEKGTLKFTHRSDLEPVLQLQAKVFYEKAAEAALLSLGELPEAQVQVLARALPHYERLERVEVDNSELAGEALQAAERAPLAEHAPSFPSLQKNCPTHPIKHLFSKAYKFLRKPYTASFFVLPAPGPGARAAVEPPAEAEADGLRLRRRRGEGGGAPALPALPALPSPEVWLPLKSGAVGFSAVSSPIFRGAS